MLWSGVWEKILLIHVIWALFDTQHWVSGHKVRKMTPELYSLFDWAKKKLKNYNGCIYIVYPLFPKTFTTWDQAKVSSDSLNDEVANCASRWL